jgi:hypothetical protein
VSYSFVDCMTQCKSHHRQLSNGIIAKTHVASGALYNQQHAMASDRYPCKAVTYGANLTASLLRGQEGNCYFKDARGFGIFDSSGLVMSGYVDT